MKVVEKMPSQLSVDAQKLYARSAEFGHTLQTREDWWTPELVPTIQELVDAGLAKYEMSNWSNKDHHYLWTDRVAKRYSSVVGRSEGLEISVRLVEQHAQRYDDQHTMKLIDIDGGYIEKRTSSNYLQPGPLWRVIARHEDGTDFEHDSMILADIWLKQVELVDVHNNGETILIGTIAEPPHLYPRGVDPFSVRNGDYEPEDDGSIYMCESEHCETPHPIGPYIGPEVPELVGKLVSVKYKVKKKSKKEKS